MVLLENINFFTYFNIYDLKLKLYVQVQLLLLLLFLFVWMSHNNIDYRLYSTAIISFNETKSILDVKTINLLIVIVIKLHFH